MKRSGNRIYHLVNDIVLLVLALVLMYPIVILFVNSFENPDYIVRYYFHNNSYTSFRLIPEMLSINQIYESLLGNRTYITAMMNSLQYSFPVTFLQLVITIPAAYGLAFNCHKGKKTVIVLMLLLMLIPYQAVEIPNFILLREINMIGNRLAVILPNLVHPLSFCILTFLMMSIDKEQLEAAELDGSNMFKIIFKIVMPQIKSGLIITYLLQFIDVWNMTEQPLIFLKDTKDMPLSILLPELISDNPGYSFGFSFMFLLPIILIYLSFHKEMTEEIISNKIILKNL